MKCFLRLLTLGIIFSVNFASSYYVSSDDESPSPMGIAETSSTKPYNILGITAEKFKSLGEFNSPCVASFRIPNPANCCIRLKCNADEICLQSFTIVEPHPFQRDAGNFFETLEKLKGWDIEEKIMQLGFLPTPIEMEFTLQKPDKKENGSRFTVVAIDQASITTESFFSIGKLKVFKTRSNSFRFNFTNPEALISSFVLEFEADDSNENELYSESLECCIASLSGRASFLLAEESKITLIGFKTIEILFNNNTLQRLRQEGRL